MTTQGEVTGVVLDTVMKIYPYPAPPSAGKMNGIPRRAVYVPNYTDMLISTLNATRGRYHVRSNDWGAVIMVELNQDWIPLRKRALFEGPKVEMLWNTLDDAAGYLDDILDGKVAFIEPGVTCSGYLYE
jgi:hypothetical protein